MLFRSAIGSEPEHEPDKTQSASDDERPLPTVVDGNERHDQRRDDGAYVRAAVKDAGRERALLLWKPFGDRFNGRWEVTRLAQAQREARRTEAKRRTRERVAHGGDRPEDDGEREALAGAEPVH